MRSHFDRASRARVVIIAVSTVATLSFFAVPSASAWPVGGRGDVAIENFTIKSKNGDTVFIPRADFANTNLSQQEITSLLTPETPEADERALVERLKADKISAASIEITAKDGAKIKLHDLLVTDVDGGRVGKLGFSDFEGSATSDGAPVTIKSGALVAEGLDMANVLKAMGSSDGGPKTGRMDHLTWNGLDIVTPDAEGGSGKPIHVALGALEVRSGYSGDALSDGSMKLTGIVIEPAPDSDEGKSLASLGYSRVELAAGISASYKAEAKTFSLDNLTVDGVQMGSIALKANFSDVPPEVFTADNNDGRLQALLESGVVSLELRLVNSGLFEKTLALIAKQDGATPEALKQQWSAMVGQMAPLFLGGSPSALKVTAEAQKFIASPLNLTVAIKAKDGVLKATDFMAITDPIAFIGKLDITAAANQ